MKRYIVMVIATMLFITAYSQVGLYLGLRGGGGPMFTNDQLNGVPVVEGSSNVTKLSNNWTANAKGEALLGLWRFRLGYQFMYLYSQPVQPYNGPNYPLVDNDRYTTYFNSSQTRLFAQYFLGEFAIVNARHFGLVPGVALGSFGGYKIDQNTGARVPLSVDTYDHFSAGGELNAEIKFWRMTFLVGPEYYYFRMLDRNYNWAEYQHYFGVDAGIRFNLL